MSRTKIIGGLMLAVLAGAWAAPASAAPLTDCPLRDAPFSTASPLVDILLSPAAMAAVDGVQPGLLSAVPKFFTSTTPPTFAAILSIREAASIGARSAPDPATAVQPDIARLDQALAAVAVTRADRIARCARYDTAPPRLAVPPAGRPRLLLFEKINGYKDTPSVDAAHAAFAAMAQRKGWVLVATDRGSAFTPAILRQFDAVIWNNISGDVLTLGQRKAFQDYLARGGAFIGVHGTAGDPVYFWDWFADTLLGARFAGHPMAPQFQDARVVVEDRDHPAARHLPAEWVMNDEWYSFKTNPRAAGATIIARLDEASYKPDGTMGQNLRMGADHPIAWSKCIGKGRMFYSAIGHRPETYSDPRYVAMLEDATGWAVTKRACVPGFTANPQPEMARSMTMRQFQQFAAEKPTDAVLARIDNEVAALKD